MRDDFQRLTRARVFQRNLRERRLSFTLSYEQAARHARISLGSSLIVSDNRLSDETGEYTDFIVLTR